MKKIPLPSSWRHQPVRIVMAGCGGTGSHLLAGLCRLHVALRLLDGPGLQVLAVDPDTVSTANLGRQLYTPMDVGQSKAEILVTRANMWHGLKWQADCAPISEHHLGNNDEGTLVIGCVDTPKARASIATIVRKQRHAWWLDLGNGRDTGQVLLGEWSSAGYARHGRQIPPNLDTEELREHFAPHPPLPSLLFPQLVEGPGDDGPSCSAAEALERQGLFINSTLANYALNLLWQWFRQGELDHHGYFVNLATGTSRPLALDPAMWERLQKQAAADAKAAAQKAKEAARLQAEDDRKWRKAREQWANYTHRARLGSRLLPLRLLGK